MRLSLLPLLLLLPLTHCQPTPPEPDPADYFGDASAPLWHLSFNFSSIVSANHSQPATHGGIAFLYLPRGARRIRGIVMGESLLPPSFVVAPRLER